MHVFLKTLAIKHYNSVVDFRSAINLTADNGKVLFCTLPTPQEEITLTKDCSLIVPDLSKAVTSFMQKSLEDIQLFLYNMQNGCIAEVFIDNNVSLFYLLKIEITEYIMHCVLHVTAFKEVGFVHSFFIKMKFLISEQYLSNY